MSVSVYLNRPWEFINFTYPIYLINQVYIVYVLKFLLSEQKYLQIQNILETCCSLLSVKGDTVTIRGLSRTRKFYRCYLKRFIPHHHLNQDGGKVTRHTLLILVNMAANHMIASILMRSAKMEANHIVAIFLNKF